MEVIYRVNGKEFNTKEKAMDYEIELQKKEQERIKKEQQRKARLKEVETARNNYFDALQKYNEDYNDVNFVLKDDKEYAEIINSLLDFFK